MEHTSNIAGPLLAFEVLTAFFLEAVFVGIMLFGTSRVPNWMHTFATALVAAGTASSAFWILALNSWMQTPAGYVIKDGVFHASDWMEILFSPSLPYRLTHMLIASGLTVSFLIAGLSSYRWLKGERSASVLAALRLGVGMAAVLAPIQIFVGDQHGLNTLEYQPEKVAAIEANWHTRSHVPLVLFAWPDEKARENHYRDLDPERRQRDPAAQPERPGAGPRPRRPIIRRWRRSSSRSASWSGSAFLMLAASWAGLYVMRRGREPTRWLARTYVVMTFVGWIATLAGWYVTEIGRQPWMVYGLLRTADVASNVSAGVIGISLTAYVIVYVLLLASYIGVLFYLARKGGPEDRTKMDAAAAAADLSQGKA